MTVFSIVLLRIISDIPSRTPESFVRGDNPIMKTALPQSVIDAGCFHEIADADFLAAHDGAECL